MLAVPPGRPMKKRPPKIITLAVPPKKPTPQRSKNLEMKRRRETFLSVPPATKSFKGFRQVRWAVNGTPSPKS